MFDRNPKQRGGRQGQSASDRQQQLGEQQNQQPDAPSTDIQHLARQVYDLETSVQRLLAVNIPLRLKS
jgi:hypothetical protein